MSSTDEVSVKEDTSRAVVERYLEEVLNGHQLGALDELVSSEALQQRVTAFLTAFPDLRVSPDRIVAEGDVAAVHLSGEATHRRMFQGMPATQRRWKATCSALYEVREGRIVDAWVNWDLLAIMEQIGAIRRVEGASA